MLLAGTGMHSTGTTAPSAGTLVGLKVIRYPAVAPVTTYSEYSVPGLAFRTWLDSRALDEPGTIAKLLDELGAGVNPPSTLEPVGRDWARVTKLDADEPE